MTVGSRPRRLSKGELESIHKSLIEVTRKQRGSDTPVDVAMPDGIGFWDAVSQLLQNMETELSETVREEGMTAKAQLLSRRLGVARTCIRDLTRIRLASFTRHAITSNLLNSVNKDSRESIGLPSLDWNKHDPSERVFYNGLKDLTEIYKASTSWSNMLGHTQSIGVVTAVSETLRDYSDDQEQESVANRVALKEERWEEPDYDEEDRIREMDDYPEHASSPSESRSMEEQTSEKSGNLLRIKVLKDVEDPILMADGSEVVLTKGDIETCPSLIAEVLIEAGLAESAPI
tara:strand:- start:877 stop:1743 length:867 start_codon:yes stop_codon:yes gene_type:complete